MVLRRSVFTALVILSAFACKEDRGDDPIPFGTFPDLTINITSYTELMTDGGAKDISAAYPGYGSRGIILYRKNATTFLAFETTCSFQPGEPCSTVGIDESKLFMKDVCCGSQFNFEGKATGDPAWRPLLQYQTSVSGISLTITDSVID